ncbi:MAG: hypothetical protein NTZ51_02150 [Proteobacteria bacterium]|nr:hypothetical protein [Pseudomonadota bacterium]
MQATGEVFRAATQPPGTSGTAGIVRILHCQTPLHFPCRRLVEAACPVHDTHAAGAVT